MNSSASQPFGIYVHIPFCLAVCPYCDFNVYAGLTNTADAYVDALIEEAAWRRSLRSYPVARSVFIGGGTPSLLPPPLMDRLLRGVFGALPFADDAEITMETNPETVDASSLRGYREAGINRVSLGVQSFHSPTLAVLGRAHTPAQASSAFHAAREAGFDNVSVDLIFGAPDESIDDWTATLARTVALQPDHVSAYGLTIESGTAFGNAVAHGRMAAPDEDEQALKYEAACDLLDPVVEHYEISNWGNRRSVHNSLYWAQAEYVGLGAGAHSHLDGTRSWNVKRPAEYQSKAASGATAGSESLEPDAAADEWLMLQLRLIEGVSIDEASVRVGRDLRSAAKPLEDAGLIRFDGDRLILTRRGMLLENEVALRLSLPD